MKRKETGKDQRGKNNCAEAPPTFFSASSVRWRFMQALRAKMAISARTDLYFQASAWMRCNIVSQESEFEQPLWTLFRARCTPRNTPSAFLANISASLLRGCLPAPEPSHPSAMFARDAHFDGNFLLFRLPHTKI